VLNANKLVLFLGTNLNWRLSPCSARPFAPGWPTGFPTYLCCTHRSKVNLYHFCSGFHTQLTLVVYAYHTKRQAICTATRQSNRRLKETAKILAS